ncbi:hypothetical protein ASE63_02315 [Bosea sp. Root381]|uniref:DUF6101 family protein n=1 Tax=Bosea sp. Root381 TaxID=1736524 RepID=UPI0006FDCF3B|nr:DUF6101 family protein [Bosea sp. Root381]KRE18042.1 hypothetical protein ASE63_02315 [Bosea sp. Root381]
MARVTTAAGEFGFMPNCPGFATDPTTVPRNPMPAQPDAPRIERIGSVRILRGAAGWRGVALRLANAAGDDELFQLALTAGDGRSIVVATVDQEDAVALWRDFGRASGMPLLLETSDGDISEPFPQIGRVALGPIRVRRRHSFLNGRRPRFLVRRKTGRLAERPVVVGGERLTD